MDMKTSGKGNISLIILSMIFAGTLITTGCSGGGGGPDKTNAYAGKANISGTIDTSSLSGSDSALLETTLPKRLLKSTKLYRWAYSENLTTGAVVKLYVVGEDGSLVDTEIEGTLSTDEDDNVTYSFEGVKDGVNYVVRYLKLLENDKVLEMKTNAYIPEGDTAPEGDVTISAKATLVVEALINAILDATNGTGIEQSVVNRIIEAVKTTIVQLVDSGAIQIPSMVVEASGDTIAEIAAAETQNDDVANASGILLSDDSVDVELSAVKTETLATRFDISTVSTSEDKRILINRVFDELLEDDDVPSFIINFFVDVYINNVSKTVDELIVAISHGLQPRQDVTTPTITKDDAINAFREMLTNVYALMAKKAAGETLSEDEKRILAETPPVIIGLFPLTERAKWESLDSGTVLNVPQGIAFTIYIVDVYIKEKFEDLEATYSATEGSGGVGVSYEKEEPFDFNPMLPDSIMDILGFYDVYMNYAGIDIFGLWINPGKVWIENLTGTGGDEVDMLMAGTCLTDVANMVAEFDGNPSTTGTDLSSATVTLTYPRTDGTRGTIGLLSESDIFMKDGGDSGMGESCFRLDPWGEAWAGKDPGTMTEPVQPDRSRIISNFTSGTYTVKVVLNGKTYSKSFAKKVITGMTDAYPTLITPLGFPRWPGDNATQAEKEEFEALMAEFKGATRFSANVNIEDSDPANDAARITMTWKAPTVTLPDGVKMRYHMEVGKGGCNADTGCTWTPYFSTWERDKILFTTSLTLPVDLPKQAQDDTMPYQLHLRVVFIDSITGERLGEGGSAHTEFWVADPLDTTKTFTVTGTAVDGYSVILFREVYDSTSLFPSYKRTKIASAAVVESTYTLEPTIGDFLSGGAGDWYNIIMYQDQDEDGEYDSTEPQYWPDWNDRIRFNTWGGTLRVEREICSTSGCERSETVILGGETINGPTLMLPSWMNP